MAESGVSNQKRKRAETGSVDRLSSLPDSLLLHILSFLPTKEAVATSFLSKRSKPLWRSLHNLDFVDRSYSGDSRFAQFVNAVLSLRGLEPIKRFRLRTESQPNIKAWVNAAIARDVEEFEFSLGISARLPACIFVSSTIRVLKLKSVSIATLPSVYLPSLKVLHLVSAIFINKESAFKLFSGCKLLEELVMINSCGIYSIEHVKGLKQLVKAQVDGYMILLRWKALHRVRFMSIDSVTTVRFSIWCPVWEKLGFPNLTHLEFIFFNHCWDFLMGWLHKCPKLQTLVIRELGPTFTEPSHGGTKRRLMEPKFVPQCLSQRLEKFYLGECQGLDNELQLARAIMENARALKTVTICSISSSSENEKLQMIKRLASYPRASETCRLLFS